jgi:hypothetical protein
MWLVWFGGHRAIIDENKARKVKLVLRQQQPDRFSPGDLFLSAHALIALGLDVSKGNN